MPVKVLFENDRTEIETEEEFQCLLEDSTISQTIIPVHKNWILPNLYLGNTQVD